MFCSRKIRQKSKQTLINVEVIGSKHTMWHMFWAKNFHWMNESLECLISRKGWIFVAFELRWWLKGDDIETGRSTGSDQRCSILNNISVISSKFINKFVQKCQCYYTPEDFNSNTKRQCTMCHWLCKRSIFWLREPI